MKSLQLSRPHAIMMVGIPGSGKTFFAEKFAATFGAPFIDSLAIEALAKDEQSAGALIALTVGEVAKTKQTFVFEGNADSRVRRGEFARWASSRGYRPLFVWVQTDEATSRARTLKSKSLSKQEFDATLARFSPPHPDEKPIVISGKHTYASQAKVVLSHLSAEARPTEEPKPSTIAAPRPATRSITVR